MRYLFHPVVKDLEKKMVFIGGPRQCGKTTLANTVLKHAKSGLYLNWDRIADQKMMLNEGWSDDQKLLVFDEFHKYPKWKNRMKGYFDTFKERHQFLVTGSARLDVYRKGGDSLLGRYHYWRLHPLSLDELPLAVSPEEGYRRLLAFGGFPEPFFNADAREARRWRRERFDRIIKED